MLVRSVAVRAAVHPHPCSRVQAALSFNVPAATNTGRWPPTTARLENASWRRRLISSRRNVDLVHPVPGGSLRLGDDVILLAEIGYFPARGWEALRYRTLIRRR